MSRGWGKVQRQILDALADGRERSVRELGWSLATAHGGISGSNRDARIRRAVYTSFERALAGLLNGSAVERRHAYFTLNDFVELYPFATPIVWIREFRSAILPELREYVRGRRPKFGDAENEIHLARTLGPKKRAKAVAGWHTLDAELCAELGGTNREFILPLIVRGRELFTSDTGYAHSVSMGILIRRALAGMTEVRQVALVGRVREFYIATFPRNEREHKRLSSLLAVAVRLEKGAGPPRLKQDFLEYALDRQRAILDRFVIMPRDRAESGQISFSMGWNRETQFDKDVHQLVGSDALRRVEFVRLSTK